MIQMKSLILKPHEVHGILSGRQTQLRRPMKQQPDKFAHVDFDEKRGWHLWWDACESWESPNVWQEYASLKSPFGQPGDHIVCKETWAEVGSLDPAFLIYRADYPFCVPSGLENVPDERSVKWSSAICMPRKHSRITLETLKVRVERIQDISEEEVQAQGISRFRDECMSLYDFDDSLSDKKLFEILWTNDYGKDSWARNDWIWVGEFKRIKP